MALDISGAVCLWGSPTHRRVDLLYIAVTIGEVGEETFYRDVAFFFGQLIALPWKKVVISTRTIQ